MSEIVGSIWWYLVTISVLVSFHEFGHYWVARRCGVHVLKFSIGFGKSLWSRTGRDGTIYSIGAIPLGGYVSMLDERVEDVPEHLRAQAHNNKNNAQKIAIAAAGPAFNFILAVLAFWLMFAIGKPDYQPVLGRVEGMAAEAGIVEGSRVLAVDGKRLRTYTEVISDVLENALYRRDVELLLRTPDGDERRVTLPLSRVTHEVDDRAIVSEIGIRLRERALVGAVSENSGAAEAGLRAGDELLAINGASVLDFEDFYQRVQQTAPDNPELQLSLRRDGEEISKTVTAQLSEADDGRKTWLLGIRSQRMPKDEILRYGILESLPAAVAETWLVTSKTLKFLGDMVTGAISPKHLSGPITIARVANAVADDGLAWFLGLMGALSVGIAILNLLPIPILDGGHILSYLIESLKGSPMSERTVLIGQYLGLGLLACLIGLALFNDVMR